MSKPPFDARAVANFVLDCGDRHGITFTKLSLQKTMFFLHGHFLSEFDQKLIIQPFEAWKYGPVLSLIYDCFSDTPGHGKIETRAYKFNMKSGQNEIAKLSISARHVDFLEDLVNVYGRIDAYTLVQITHRSDSPWTAIWRTRTNRKPSPGLRVRDEDIKNFFLDKGNIIPH